MLSRELGYGYAGEVGIFWVLVKRHQWEEVDHGDSLGSLQAFSSFSHPEFPQAFTTTCRYTPEIPFVVVGIDV